MICSCFEHLMRPNMHRIAITTIRTEIAIDANTMPSEAIEKLANHKSHHMHNFISRHHEISIHLHVFYLKCLFIRDEVFQTRVFKFAVPSETG